MNNKVLNVVSNLLVLLCMVSTTMQAVAENESMTKEELEEWFRSDQETVDPIKLINEGELVFLSKKPERQAHQAKHLITILPDSLVDGWVKLYQCHENLDVMPAAQVVFMNKRVRKLKVISSKNIDKTWVEQDTVQMKKIARDASLCIELETRAFWKNADGSYSLRTGPYQRRFLDGYFPVRLLLDIKYPGKELLFKGVLPESQAGFSVKQKSNVVNINALFEGRLHVVVTFVQK